MRRTVFVGSLFLAVATTLCAQQNHVPAAQTPTPAAHPAQEDFAVVSPFFFPPGAPTPTPLSPFRQMPAVKSPDGETQITVTGPSESLKAWVTLQFLGRYVRGLEYQVWPIERSVDVLWRPDSQAFALTDNRYANRSYVLVCGTNFRLGETQPGLGIPIADLTPVVRKAFEVRMQRYYAPHTYEIRLFYAMVLRWIQNDRLLVGVDATVVGPPAFPNRGVKEWDTAYLVNVPRKTLVRELSEAQLLRQYGIRVAK